jgi:hypothetical protein
LSEYQEAGLMAFLTQRPEATAATPAPAPAIARLLPSFTDVAFLVPIFVLYARMKGAPSLLGDGDTGWHLRTGQWILANGRVPNHDIFSFTKPGEPWFAWEWLWDVAFGWLEAQWGMAAVIFASTLVIAATFAVLYRLALWKSGNPVLAIVATLVAAFGSSVHWLARPHLFTLLLVAVFYTVIERAQAGNTRALWWLPALTVLWTNLHGGFIAGVVLLGAYAAGELVSVVTDTRPGVREASLVRARRYAGFAAACLAASLLNPYGYQLHVHIFRYLTDPFLFETISEFLSLNFQHPVARYFEAMMALGVVAAAWNIYHRRFAYAILLAAWMHVALTSARNFPIYVIIAAPLVSECLADLARLAARAELSAWIRRTARGLLRLSAEAGQVERIGRIPAISAVGVVLLLLLLRGGVGPRFTAAYDSQRFPAKVADLLRAPEYNTGVLTTDVWGGYLIYRLYPNFKVFFDGRSDFYGPQFAKKYIELFQCRYDWQKTLDRCRIRTLLLPVEAPLATTLKESPRWRAIYDDGVAIVFRSVTADTSSAAVPERLQAPAVSDGGLPAIARSRTPNPVIHGSQSYARR